MIRALALTALGTTRSVMVSRLVRVLASVGRWFGSGVDVVRGCGMTSGVADGDSVRNSIDLWVGKLELLEIVVLELCKERSAMDPQRQTTSKHTNLGH